MDLPPRYKLNWESASAQWVPSFAGPGCLSGAGGPSVHAPWSETALEHSGVELSAPGAGWSGVEWSGVVEWSGREGSGVESIVHLLPTISPASSCAPPPILLLPIPHPLPPLPHALAILASRGDCRFSFSVRPRCSPDSQVVDRDWSALRQSGLPPPPSLMQLHPSLIPPLPGGD